MEGEDNNDLPPFWLQTSDSFRWRRRLRRSSSLFFNSGAVLIVLIVIALVFIFIIVPSILSFTSQIFRPHSVKKSWDSLNLVLVLFAIVCGFLSRNSNGENTSPYDPSVSNSTTSQETQKSNPSTPHRWYEYSDQTESFNNNGMSRLRSSSSYPDLRQESSWVTRDERWRFYDDTHMSNYHPISSDQLHSRRPWQEPEKQEEEEEENQNLEPKNIEVDTFQVRTKDNSHNPEPQPQRSSPPPPQPPPPAPAPAPVTKRKAKRSYQAIQRNDFSELKNENSHLPPPPTSRPPSPPQALPEYQESEPKSGKSEKKRSTATKDFINSLRRKKKKQRQKSVENFDSIISSMDPPPSSSSYPSPSPPPPPPPPPPPLPSVFHNLFSSKKGKTKKPHSPFSQPPLHLPPPPSSSTVRVSKSKTLSKPIPVTQKPPLPIKTSNTIVGNESPPTPIAIPIPIPIPPPPPPPPFKIKDWKFVRQGDFVRIKSSGSSRSVSPDLDGGEDSPSEGMSPLLVAEGGQSPSPVMSCPSPDVDTKADNFIARFRAGLRLEKENSIRERDSTGRSRFGPEPVLGRG